MAEQATSKIFVSYSRADSGFVDDLVAGLEADGAFEVSIDRQGIGHGEDWRARLGALILECDTMVFVMSPDSLQSEICAWEVEEAQRLGRRIVPALWRDVDFAAAPPGLSAINVVPFVEHQVIRGLAQLITALKTDLDWLRAHTTLSERAEEWAARERPAALLLRGAPLREAQGLLAARPETAPETPAALHEFVAAGVAAEAEALTLREREVAELRAANAAAAAAGRRIRRWLTLAVLALIVAVAAGGFALISGRQAIEAQEELERQRQAAVESEARAIAEATAAEAEREAAIAARREAEESAALTQAALDRVIFDIVQGLENIEGVSPAAIARILEETDRAFTALLARDPENAALRRSRAVMLIEFGDVYARTGQADAALAAYEESLTILRALAAAEPENTEFQRDVSVSLNKVGDLRLRRGEADAASAAYEEGLQIRRALAAAEPENVQAQTDVVVSLFKVAQVAEGAGKRAALEEALGILRRLDADGLLSADQQQWPALIEAELAKIAAE